MELDGTCMSITCDGWNGGLSLGLDSHGGTFGYISKLTFGKILNVHSNVMLVVK